MSTVPMYFPTIVIDQVIDAIATFLTPFLPEGCPVIRGQQNRVSPPNTPGQSDALAFVLLQEIMMSDLETPTVIQSAVGTQQSTITTPTQIDVQISFYGQQAGDYCKAVKTVFRSVYTPDQFPTGIAPLYASNASKGALITGEEQYEDRWDLTASMQYNPSVILPQQSATVLKFKTFEDVP